MLTFLFFAHFPENRTGSFAPKLPVAQYLLCHLIRRTILGPLLTVITSCKWHVWRTASNSAWHLGFLRHQHLRQPEYVVHKPAFDKGATVIGLVKQKLPGRRCRGAVRAHGVVLPLAAGIAALHFDRMKSNIGRKTSKCAASIVGTTSLAKVTFWLSLINLINPSVRSVSTVKCPSRPATP